MYDLIVIGAGPAGVSMAAEARHAGIAADKILILEKAPEHSYSVRKLYPEQKLVTANYKGHEAVCFGVMCLSDSSKADTLSYLDKAIFENDIKVQYQTQVYSIQKKEEGHFYVATDKGDYESRICVIAIGIFGKPKRPDYALPSIAGRVHFDLTTHPIKESSVLVVGGGDSASEYAQYLVQEKNQVSLSYRQNEFSRMNDINRQSLLKLIEEKKVNFLAQSNITQVTESEGKPLVKFAGAEGEMKFDHVVYALGGTTPQNFLKLIGIEFNGDTPEVRDDYETSIPGLFLIGDLSAGKKGGSIIAAFNSSHKAMKRICENYLECKL